MTKKIKLVHITSSLKVGGAEAVLCDLVKKLEYSDGEVWCQELIYFHDGPNLEKIKKMGIKCHQIKGLFCLYDPVFFVRLFFLIKKLDPEVVHSLLWSANVSSRLVVKCLNMVKKIRPARESINFEKEKNFTTKDSIKYKLNKIKHVSAYHNKTSLYTFVQNFLDKITRNLSDKIVAVSEDVAYSICNNYKNEENVPVKFEQEYLFNKRILNKNNKFLNKLVVIKNGLDFEDIKNRCINAIERKDLGLQTNDFVIGSVGRFCPEKNIEFLILSFSELIKEHNLAKNSELGGKNLKLVLLGVGAQEEYLKNLAKDLGIEKEIIFVVGKIAYDYYKIFDCFVQPASNEGLSIALLEAMSFEKLCLVAGSGKEFGFCAKESVRNKFDNSFEKEFLCKEKEINSDAKIIDNSCKEVGHPVIENSKNGIIFYPDFGLEGQKALSSCLKDAILNFQEYQKLAMDARATVENDFSINSMINGYKKVFTQ